MKELQARDIILQRLAKNGLSVPFNKPLDCVRMLAGIQSQFQQYAEVSIMNRCSGAVTTEDLAKLYTEHAILNLWGQRNTLHMYVKEDWDYISGLYEPRVSGKKYAHTMYPEDFDFLMRCVQGECASSHQISKARIMELIEERMQGRHSPQDSFEYVFIILCCLRGIFFGLPQKPGIKTFVSHSRVRDSPCTGGQVHAEAALESLMLRYFTSYGPATREDFCHWSGLSQTEAKVGIDKLADKLMTCTHDSRVYYTGGELVADPPHSGVFLLGKFDPLFVSYRHKDWLVPPDKQKQIWRNAGWVEAVIIEGDRLAGTWRHKVKGRKMCLSIDAFGKIKAASKNKIYARAERLAAFWSKELDTVEYS